MPSSALAEELTAAADAYVRVGYSTNYNDGSLLVKCSGGGGGSTTRKAFIRFQRTSSEIVSTAIMRLGVSSFNDSGGATSADFYLWGVQNNHAAEDFSERGVTHNTYTDLLDTSADGVTDNLSALLDDSFESIRDAAAVLRTVHLVLAAGRGAIVVAAPAARRRGGRGGRSAGGAVHRFDPLPIAGRSGVEGDHEERRRDRG